MIDVALWYAALVSIAIILPTAGTITSVVLLLQYRRDVREGRAVDSRKVSRWR